MFQLKNDEVAAIPILANINGTVGPYAPAEAFSTQAPNPEILGTAIGKGPNNTPALILTPKGPSSSGIVVKVLDGSGAQVAELPVVIVPSDAVKIVLDVTHAARGPQIPPATPPVAAKAA